MDAALIILIFAIFFAVFDTVLYFINKKLIREIDEMREQTAKDLDECTALLLQNMNVLNEIEKKRANIISHTNDDANMAFIKEKRDTFRAMSYDEFVDWLDKGQIEYIEKAIPFFESAELTREAEIMRIYLKRQI